MIAPTAAPGAAPSAAPIPPPISAPGTGSHAAAGRATAVMAVAPRATSSNLFLVIRGLLAGRTRVSPLSAIVPRIQPPNAEPPQLVYTPFGLRSPVPVAPAITVIVVVVRAVVA